MKDRRKKVFLMSVLVFLVCSSTVYIFLILNAVDDLRTKPYFSSQYSGTKRAIIPILKYLGVVDTEVVSDSKKISDMDMAKTDEIFGSNLGDAKDYESDLNNSYGGRKASGVYGYSKPFKSSSKLSSGINSSSLSGGAGGTNTSASISGAFASSSGKNAGVGKNTDIKDNPNYKAENLMARLNTTKTLMSNAINSKSADGGRMDWEKGFSGSVKPGGNMFYKNNAIELDKMKAGVMDLKIDDTKGLKAPDVGAPQPDRNSVSGDKKKELMQSLTQSMINAIGNGIGAGMGAGIGGDGGGESLEEQPNSRSGSNSIIEQEVEKWKFDSNEKVETAYFPCGMIDCDSMGVNGGGIYKAYFPDGFVLSLNPNGKPLNYYYSVSPNNESAFLENYQKYAPGQ